MSDLRYVLLAFGVYGIIMVGTWFHELRKDSLEHQQRHLVWFRKSLRAISRREPLEPFEEHDRWCKICKKADRIRIRKKGTHGTTSAT